LDPCLSLQAAAAPDAPPVPPPQIGSSFAGFCEASRLSPALRDMAAYAIVHHPGPFAAGGHAGGQAGGEDADGGEGDEGGLTARDAIVAVCRHLRSLGCYGPTAYLLPLYGASELPQAFCRLCAVWGGTYMLAQRAHALRVDGGRAMAVEDGAGRRIGCEWAVLGSQAALPAEAAGEGAGGGVRGREVARCVAVLDAPLLGACSPEEQLSFATLLPPAGGAPVFALQLDATCCACPSGLLLLHLSAEVASGSDPRAVLEPALARLRALAERGAACGQAEGGEGEGESESEGEDGGGGGGAEGGEGGERRAPSVCWGAYFSLPLHTAATSAQGGGGLGETPDNVLHCHEASLEITCDDAVARAKALFARVCPGVSFLPTKEQASDQSDGEEAA